MIRLFLALILTVTAQSAEAVHCDGKPIGPPCDPGIVGADKKKDVLDLIRAANKMDGAVKRLEARYLAVRGNPGISPEKKLAVLAPYRSKKSEQYQLYKQAIDKTQALYRVGPNHSSLTVGRPEDADLNYMENLSADWNPQPAEFDKKGMFGVKILGSDNQFHYGGVVRDAEFGDIVQAATIEDGRVFIFKETFDQALKYKNPGYLAQQLYHESRHFDQLSRPDVNGSGVRRSWASVEEDERDAYKAVVDEATTFGLDAEDKKSLDGKWFRYDFFVKKNHLTRRTVNPRQKAIRKEFYETVQVNLEEEYAALQASILFQSRLSNLNEQNRIAREREALTRIGTMAEWEAAAAQCGYRLDLRSHAPSTVFGFRNSEDLHLLHMGLKTPSLRDLKIILLISRTCDEVRRQPPPERITACNDAVSGLSTPMSPEAYSHLQHANSDLSCVDAILAAAPTIKDAKSFEKSVTAYQKRRKKKSAADNAKWERDFREREKRERGGQHDPGGDGRTPRESPDHDEVWRRIKPIIQ